MLTTIERVKRMPGFALYDDDYLSLLIAAASAEIEAYLNRRLALEEVTERKDGSALSAFISLSRYPVEQLISIVAGDELITDADLVSPDLGCLYRKTGWKAGVGNISVTYRGGYILPGCPGANLPENIELACILEVQQLIRSPGVTSERVGEVAVTYANDKLCSASRSLLEGHRRFT